MAAGSLPSLPAAMAHRASRTVRGNNTAEDIMPEVKTDTEDAVWRDAYGIAWVGASNPAAVAATLGRHSAAITREIGTDGARHHPALRAIAGHLAFLFGYGLGPDSELLDAVETNAKRLGLIPQ